MTTMGKIIFSVILLTLLPILVNVIVGSENPTNLNIIGTTSDWLLFYGSYIGGVITATISFIAVYKEGKRNRVLIEISRQEEHIKKLKQTLSNSISLFDYSRVGVISMYFKDRSKYNDVLQEMDEYLGRVTTTANAWNVIYGDSTQKEIKEFQEVYKDCCEKLITAINEVSKLICKLKEDLTAEERLSEITKINNIINKQEEYKSVVLSLQDKARDWIKTESENLKKLQGEL